MSAAAASFIGLLCGNPDSSGGDFHACVCICFFSFKLDVSSLSIYISYYFLVFSAILI